MAEVARSPAPLQQPTQRPLDSGMVAYENDPVAVQSHDRPHSISEVVSSKERSGVSPADDEPAKFQDFPRGPRFWAIIISLGVTNLLGALENTVVTTSGPTIVADLGLGENYIWITNAFFLCRLVPQPALQQRCLY